MCSRLQPYIGWRIAVTTLDQRAVHLDRYLPGAELPDHLGQIITGVFRRGKHLVIALERGALLCHNAMSGYWDTFERPWSFDYVEGKRLSKESDVRVAIMIEAPGELQDGSSTRMLRFHDARKFGSLRYVTPEQLAEKLSRLGPDALRTPCLYEPTATMTAEQFAATFSAGRASGHPIKAALMEQDMIAGAGNIYAAEACWLAKIDPRRKGETLGEQELRLLFSSVRLVLQSALDRKLDYGGLNIYRRKKCGCGAETKTEKLVGRTTTWCPACQK